MRQTLFLIAVLVGLVEMPAFAADTARPLIVVQNELGEALTMALLSFDGPAKSRIGNSPEMEACAEPSSATPHLAIMAGQPRALEIEACRQATASDVLSLTIGHQAIVLVTPFSARAFALRTADLFGAVGQRRDKRPVPAVWRDTDPTLPNMPIGLLAPPVGSLASRLLTTYVLEPACSRETGAPVPFELARRLDYCGALRVDPGIAQRHADGDELAEWAASAPAGQLAVVTMEELGRLDRAVVAVPLDGVLPTAANIEAGRYPGAERVTLLIVMPRDMSSATRNLLRQAAFELLSERSIGPEGSLARAGLIPLSPARRVAARSRANAFVEHP